MVDVDDKNVVDRLYTLKRYEATENPKEGRYFNNYLLKTWLIHS